MSKPRQNTIVRPKRTYFGPNEPFVHCHDDVYNQQKTQGRCGICGKNTFYKSLYAAEYCCSVECSNELWCQITESVASTSSNNKRRRNQR